MHLKYYLNRRNRFHDDSLIKVENFFEDIKIGNFNIFKIIKIKNTSN